jgi:hypothetical protein
MKFNGSLAVNYESSVSGTSTYPSANAGQIYVYGLYPKEWTVNSSDASSAEITFTGSEDVMAAAKISTVTADVINGDYKTLNFKHLLTRLEVKLSGGSATLSTLGSVSSIKLIGDETNGTTLVNNKITLSNSNSSPEPTFSSASSATSLNFYSLSYDAGTGAKTYANTAVSAYTLTTVPTFVGYSMVAPVTATSANKKEYYLEVVTSSSTKRFPVDLMDKSSGYFDGTTAGRSFVVAIHFISLTEIAVKATVQDWDEQGEWQGEISI